MRLSLPCWTLRAALSGLLLLAVSGPLRAQDLKKLHVLLVFDTEGNLADGLKIDRGHVKGVLARHIPKDLYTLKLIEGRGVSRQNILASIKELKMGPDEGILFFYGGHGGSLGNKQFLALTSGKLYREELLAALEAKKAGLVVLLTDCCSNKVKLGRGEEVDEKGAEELKGVTPVVRQLFFQTRGLVDITAATNDKAYGDDDKGGLFTRAFCRSLEYRSLKDRKPATPAEVLARLDANKDGVVSWQEFFPVLRDDTTALFRVWMDDPAVRGDPELKNARPQVPQAFKLGTQGTSGVSGKGKEFLVVSLINRTEKLVHYEYRWGGESAWKEGKAAAGGQVCLFRHAPGGSESAALEVRLKGSDHVSKLEPGRWSGSGTPTFKDGRLYNWKPRK